MGMFLNSRTPYDGFREAAEDTYFVDKTLFLNELIPSFGKRNRYLCITRPRRFGKTVMANMVGAFFGKAVRAASLFEHLEISAAPAYQTHLNRYELIYIDFSKTPKDCDSYSDYIRRIQDGIVNDLTSAYPDCCVDRADAVWDALQKIHEKTADKFVFVMDEWDAAFHMTFLSAKDRQNYLLFLKNMLKDQTYTEFVYMTGILPVAKYSSGSELNMFVEYDMATSEKFSEYFGFLDTEVDRLYSIYQSERKQAKTDRPAFTREDLRLWYDGYYTAVGSRLYNPRSVILALTDRQLRNYWTSSGPYDEIFYYIRNNIEDVRDDLVFLAAGERIAASVGQFSAADMDLKTKDQIYSAMVIYGLLTYDKGDVLIPNRELMDKLNELLLTKDSLGYVYQLAKKSDQMLQATLNGDTKKMAEILQFAHDTESPVLSYNNEAELAAAVNLCYLSARSKYRIEREDRAGKGFADFLFYPERKNGDCIILELKVDSTPQEAVDQIKEKNYALRFQGKLGERPKYSGRILAVGISYSRSSKEHQCKIEQITHNA